MTDSFNFKTYHILSKYHILLFTDYDQITWSNLAKVAKFVSDKAAFELRQPDSKVLDINHCILWDLNHCSAFEIGTHTCYILNVQN